MCIVSAVHDSIQQQFPIYNSTGSVWTWELYYKLQEVIKKVEELDKLAGAPDCVDPAKAKFVAEILDYLEKKDKLK